MQQQSKNTHHQTSAREILFSATKDLHQQLDCQPAIRSLLKKELNHAEHLAVLAKFYRAYRKVESALIKFDTNNIHKNVPKYAPRLMALHTDMEDQIFEKKAGLNSKTSNYCADKPISLAQYWGIRYVLDGSCHGASMLLPKLSNYYSNNDNKPLAYWTLLANLNKDWPIVCQQIEQIGRCPKALHEMTTMARLVFTDFIES